MNKFKSIKTSLSYILEIPKIVDEGFLCFAEGEKNIPFDIKRIYYIFDESDYIRDYNLFMSLANNKSLPQSNQVQIFNGGNS